MKKDVTELQRAEQVSQLVGKAEEQVRGRARSAARTEILRRGLRALLTTSINNNYNYHLNKNTAA